MRSTDKLPIHQMIEQTESQGLLPGQNVPRGTFLRSERSGDRNQMRTKSEMFHVEHFGPQGKNFLFTA